MHLLRPVLFSLLGVVLAAGSLSAQSAGAGGPADEYFRGYILKGEAERMEQSGDALGALAKYRQAQEIFDSIAKNYPVWEAEMLTYRRQKLNDAIARVEAQPASSSPAPAAQDAPEPEPSARQGPLPTIKVKPAPLANPGPVTAAPLPATNALLPVPESASQPGVADGLPSLSEFFNNYERAYKNRFEQLDRQNKQYEGDLVKWQKWYEWASGELRTSKDTIDSLTERGAQLEKAVAQMERDAKAGRANSAELTQLKQQQAQTTAELAQARAKLAAAQKAVSEGAGKLAEATDALTKMRSERDSAVKDREGMAAERDAAQKKADAAGKERDKLAAETLGVKTELDNLKRATGAGSSKAMLAKNEQLRKELDEARAMIEKLKGDVTKKDAEITQLKGQLAGVQGELANLRKENAAYQTQVSELTLQLKDVQSKMETKTEQPPGLLAENQMLRGIILRQLRAQARQQEAKTNIIAELQKTENASKDLLQQVEELSTARVTLTPDEEKLFTDPQLKEALGTSGFQATLMASSTGKSPNNAPAAAPSPEAEKKSDSSSPAALMEKGNRALQDDKLAEAAAAYEDLLRAEPKNASALIGLGSARMREGKYAEAEVALKKCLKYEPDNDAAHFTLGITHFKQDHFKESMSSFESSLDKQPKNARAHHYLGIIASKMSLLPRAEREFKTALAIDPAYGDAHFNLAVLYISWDPPKWEEARSQYADAIKKGVKADPNLEKILDGKAVSAR